MLGLLISCTLYPEVVDSGAPAPAPTDCSESVLVPTGLLDGQDDLPADAHAEIYGASPAPQWVRYQWPSSDPSTSAAFLWSTDTDTLASAVVIGPADTFPQGATRHEGYSFLFGSGEIGAGDSRVHEVRLCQRLEPGTVYRYQVGGEGGWSETFTITTPGPPGSFDTFTVGIVGDSRGGYETWGQLLAAMDAYEPDFLMFSGDMVDLGGSQDEWEAWLEASGDVLARRPLIAAHGNHEFLAQNYFAQFAFPGNEEWFSVQYGDLLLVTLNDTVRESTQLSDTQALFLDETLTAADPEGWKMVMHHQSAYATCSTHGSDADTRAFWTPLYEEHGVDAVIAGHNHAYERSVPIRDGQEVGDGEGPVYFVTGGAGAPLYDSSDPQWFGAVFEPVNHYIIARFSPDSIAFEARDLSGNVIDTYTIPR